jgi:hypothetical protein
VPRRTSTPGKHRPVPPAGFTPPRPKMRAAARHSRRFGYQQLLKTAPETGFRAAAIEVCRNSIAG